MPDDLYCPFCDNYTVNQDYMPTGMGGIYIAKCARCGARGPSYIRGGKPIQQWQELIDKIQGHTELLEACENLILKVMQLDDTHPELTELIDDELAGGIIDINAAIAKARDEEE